MHSPVGKCILEAMGQVSIFMEQWSRTPQSCLQHCALNWVWRDF